MIERTVVEDWEQEALPAVVAPAMTRLGQRAEAIRRYRAEPARTIAADLGVSEHQVRRWDKQRRDREARDRGDQP